MTTAVWFQVSTQNTWWRLEQHSSEAINIISDISKRVSQYPWARHWPRTALDAASAAYEWVKTKSTIIEPAHLTKTDITFSHKWYIKNKGGQLRLCSSVTTKHSPFKQRNNFKASLAATTLDISLVYYSYRCSAELLLFSSFRVKNDFQTRTSFSTAR